ncbi:endo-1,4-beta-xylanase [Olivibacter sitiensis]|uniref:endo-1,4-beta-xylanase n=1 Tax=Olivibacter sitiensis TaxID=376470 RepID=UPI000412C213|nr:endo-1,4-beta-xylanase [Olivibacter sitiensis]
MKIFTSFIIGLLVFDCNKQPIADNNPEPEEEQTADTSLRNLSPFPFGAAVNINLLKNRPAYRNLVIEEFNSVTAENAMKIRFIHPQQNTYDWADADYLVDFAEEHDMRVHGHNLVWHQNLPDWITSFQGDSAAWENIMKTHIQTVVTRYKGRVASWDVVNEALDNDGHGLRESLWLSNLGPDYIARAFEYAHEADPDALLFYNDYGNEFGPTKRNAIVDLVTGLKNRNIPIHGIGMQMHTRFNREDNFHEAAITSAAATGLMVHISELDIAVNPNNDPNLTYTPAIQSQQAQKYFHIARTFHNIADTLRHGITTWNVSDADTWITGRYERPDWPLPFDENYQRKTAYYRILEAVNP